MANRALWVEPDKCLGCKTCELECALAHCEAGDLVEALQLALRPASRIKVVAVGANEALPIHCRQCERPRCVAVCPVGALTKAGPGEAVLLDADKCTGCLECVKACPFEAMMVTPDGTKAVKCDLCPARLAEGLEPACVASCPTEALHFGELGEVAREAARRAMQLLRAVKAAQSATGNTEV
ncbi:MAG: 4Fe-4S binding protein [Armatimonadetes bacterium]|nr:4Fe-4S binding protein [Armatimonadota bacterium]